MLKRISNFFTFNQRQKNIGEPIVVQSGRHSLSPKMISRDARKVVEVLQEHGFEAYVVGGSVRDLLLGLKPKDFDVATNAKPSEIKPLFRRSRIIGRRFQIVHVQFSRELIEVTTFRSNETLGKDKPGGNRRQQTDSGMLTRDNVFGSIDDDASRRDLTINALYYDPSDNSIYDFAGGLEDIENRTLRIMGDPATRFREDPVRMLRVVRFAAKLGFTIDPATEKPMHKLAGDLEHISAPRLFDETLKLFMSGQGLATFWLLHDYGLFELIVPQLGKLLNNRNSQASKLVQQAFTNTDLRIRSDKRVTPAFIYAALLWPLVQNLASRYQERGNSPAYALNKAAGEIIAKQIPVTAIPRRFTMPMREIWDLQLTLQKRGGQRAKRLAEHPRFRAAYDFVLLREQAGEDLNGLGDWWTAYQEADEEKRELMANALTQPKNKRRRRKPRTPKAD
ncbi:MAG: polynucleotide adenylyltransferase PcnB [Porticoccaceae bacterium]|jgi:poly(A) polymerase|nr:polynucleotide adenylyltransferase PcnB [Porticoccaceae bacterium]MBT5578588.1 polynucleotide adenylyltransferase PcnB [Porticoccaceae bacterium]